VASSASSPRFGVTVDAGTLIVLGVQPGSLAANIGLRRGDRFIAIDGRRLRGIQDLQAFLERQPSSAVLTVARNRRLADVRVNF
jgi:S1-C subfamily serine protease